MQKTKALSWLFSREYQKSGKAEHRSRQIFFIFCWGTCLGISRAGPEVWSYLALHISASFLMTLSRAGFLTLASSRHGPDWFLKGKGVCQGYILSPWIFNLYAVYIMRNAGLEETQAGIRIAGRNIKHLRYADDTNLMAESERNWKASWWQ